MNNGPHIMGQIEFELVGWLVASLSGCLAVWLTAWYSMHRVSSSVFRVSSAHLELNNVLIVMEFSVKTMPEQVVGVLRDKMGACLGLLCVLCKYYSS